MSDGTKECNYCYMSQPLSQFDIDLDKPDGHRGRCKDCRGRDDKMNKRFGKEKRRLESKLRDLSAGQIELVVEQEALASEKKAWRDRRKEGKKMNKSRAAGNASAVGHSPKRGIFGPVGSLGSEMVGTLIETSAIEAIVTAAVSKALVEAGVTS